MESLWKCVVLALCCVPLAAPQEAVSTACGVDSVAVRVLLDYSRSALPLDPSGLLLGTCPPSSTSAGNNMVVFQYGLLHCRFMRMVTANVTSYMNVLTYKPTQKGFYQTPFNQAIVCTYTNEMSWVGCCSHAPLSQMTSQPHAPPVCSSWGSPINIAAAVKQQFHMPLMVYMEECVAASTPELSPSSQTYPLITNHGGCRICPQSGSPLLGVLVSPFGCFVDGQVGNSRFLPRVQTSEIRLVVQAFRFTQLNTDVYIHCRLLAWDPAQLNDPTKKACSFNQRTRSWELLDNPGRSTVCSCCTSNCNLRKRRGTEPQQALALLPVLAAPLLLMAVLGALSLGYYIWELLDNPGQSSVCSCCTSNCNLRKRRDTEPQQALALLPVLAAPLLLMAVLGALSLGYYICEYSLRRGLGGCEGVVGLLLIGVASGPEWPPAGNVPSIQQQRRCISIATCWPVTLPSSMTPPRKPVNSTREPGAVSTACGVDSVAVRVLLDYSRSALPLDPSGLLLGTCSPSSTSAGNNMVVFQYGLLDCRFMRMVTANVTSYMNVLTYKPTQRGFYQTPFNQAIVCTYTKCISIATCWPVTLPSSMTPPRKPVNSTREPGEPQQALAWLPVLAAPLLLMAVLGALSLGYYMCMWRHPRLCSKSSSGLLVPAPVDEMHTAVGTVSSNLPAQQF
ncbi:UNVERIFIED_CONTAM: hypothetical protein FKN15_062639 [Acipenser sinensis]